MFTVTEWWFTSVDVSVNVSSRKRAFAYIPPVVPVLYAEGAGCASTCGPNTQTVVAAGSWMPNSTEVAEASPVPVLYMPFHRELSGNCAESFPACNWIVAGWLLNAKRLKQYA